MTHPERLGKYTLTGVLGDGAMGVVYTGFDAGIQRRVALKTIHKKLIDDDQQAEPIAARFRNEAQAVGRLLHPALWRSTNTAKTRPRRSSRWNTWKAATSRRC